MNKLLKPKSKKVDEPPTKNDFPVIMLVGEAKERAVVFGYAENAVSPWLFYKKETGGYLTEISDIGKVNLVVCSTNQVFPLPSNKFVPWRTLPFKSMRDLKDVVFRGKEKNCEMVATAIDLEKNKLRFHEFLDTKIMFERLEYQKEAGGEWLPCGEEIEI